MRPVSLFIGFQADAGRCRPVKLGTGFQLLASRVQGSMDNFRPLERSERNRDGGGGGDVAVAKDCTVVASQAFTKKYRRS